MACHIRRDDIVEEITGDHKGERGKVLKVLPKRGLVVVQGINMVYRHVRPSRQNPQGGRLQKDAPIHISNVLPVDDKGAKGGTRVRFESAATPTERRQTWCPLITGRVVSRRRRKRNTARLPEVLVRLFALFEERLSLWPCPAPEGRPDLWSSHPG
jgi:large subunit ribosomal protein L24